MKQLFGQKLMILVWAAALAVTGCTSRTFLPGEGPDRGKTVIYRDSWGVPIFMLLTSRQDITPWGGPKLRTAPVACWKTF